MERTKFTEHIFSLDDIGANSRSDELAISLIEERLVDRISLMTGNALGVALQAAIKKSGVKTDIHLHLLGQEYEKALDTFWLRFLFMCKIYLSRKMRRTIYEAWNAQIDVFKRTMGSTPDGINSHEHIHFLPPLFKLVVMLAEKHGIPYIRQGTEVASTNDYRALFLRFFQKKNRPAFLKSSLHTSTSLYSFDWEDQMISVPGGSEIIFHPQYTSDTTFLRSLRGFAQV
jgi:predicted glycoside hydrolase/deacetylase ChbG (UPF0249 family)